MKPSTKLILGSQSPRRKELLENAGFGFDVKAIDFNEDFSQEMAAIDVAEYLAEGKNQACRLTYKEEVIITADTIVILDDVVLGKPKNADEAANMLSSLSGRTHLVVTGVCISNAVQKNTFRSETQVKVSDLTSEEIDYYIHNYKPFDKAGAYGIQEWYGLIGVEWIKGSFYNVVGLPIDRVYQVLKKEFEIGPSD